LIDLHTHVLPGLDDGPASIEASLAMVRVAADSGTRIMTATPHVREDYPGVRPAEIGRRVEELNVEIARAGLAVRVAAGAEVAVDALGLLADDELREATLGGNGRDLLVETPYGAPPLDFDRELFSLGLRGYRVTLAHPERSHAFQADPERLGRLSASGVLVQISGNSLASSRGGRARSLALIALERGWAHVLASDGHSARWRPPDLRAALVAALAAAPDRADELEWMVSGAPEAVLAGRELPPRPARLAHRPWKPFRRRRKLTP
jgi:protein-tyrosine phosphatase